MFNTPKGHTSIYFSDYIKSNWQPISQYVIGRGFKSVNQYINSLVADDFHVNAPKVFNTTFFHLPQRIDFNLDSAVAIKEKLLTYKDDDYVELLRKISSIRDVVLKDAKRRGIKI